MCGDMAEEKAKVYGENKTAKKATKKTAKKDAKQSEDRVRSTMYTQQIEYMKDNIPDLYSDDLQVFADNIKKRLEDNEMPVKYVAVSLHDADMLRVWDAKQADYVLEPKEEHDHVAIKFEDRVPFSKISEAIGDAPQNFEKPGKGKYVEENMLAYLVHAKSPNKHFYSPDTVKVAGMLPTRNSHDIPDAGTYQRYYREHREAWMKFRATRKIEEDSLGIDELFRMVIDFKVSRRDIFQNPEFFEIYITDQTKIDKAFQARVEKRFWDLRKSFDRGEFDFTSLYIYGDSGSGKTTLANKIADDLLEKGHAIYEAAATNPFDDYTGEDVVVIDDVKLNTLSPDEWLKVLDPINYSSLGARYKNKKKAFKTIIITGVFRPESFFEKVINNVKGYDIEPLVQFVRRLMYTCHAVDGTYTLNALTQEKIGGEYAHAKMLENVGTEKAASALSTLISYNSEHKHERTHRVLTMKDIEELARLLDDADGLIEYDK